MVGAYVLSFYPSAVLKHPAATEDTITLLSSVLIYRDKYNPHTKEAYQNFMLGTMKHHKWSQAQMQAAMENMSKLIEAFPDLEHVQIVMPNMRAAKA